jgi:hypothetical protein
MIIQEASGMRLSMGLECSQHVRKETIASFEIEWKCVLVPNFQSLRGQT